MKKLTGCGEKKAIARPSHVKASASTIPIPIAMGGRLENLTAIAAGVTMRAKISSTPTTCTASLTATARIAMNAIDSAVTGTPLAPGQVLVDR